MRSGIDGAGLDVAVRPQDDLFGHVNGRWVAETPIPQDRGRYGSFDILREAAESQLRVLIEEAAAAGAGPGTPLRQVGDLFSSFMDVERVDSLGLAPVAGLLEQVESLTSTSELPALLGGLQREGGPGAFSAVVSTDDRDSQHYIVYLEQGGIGLPDESYYREDRYAAVREGYRAHLERMLALTGARQPGAAARRVLELESALAAHHLDAVANRDALRTYTKVDRRQLADLVHPYDVQAWARALGAPSAAVDHVVVRQPAFLQAVGEALTAQPLRAWQDWLRWQIVHSYAAYLGAGVVEEDFAFFGRTLSGTPLLRERWKRGVALVEWALGEALGRLYVERHFPPQAKARMEVLVGNLVEAFRRDFASLPWMGEATRAEALAKLEQFTPKIGHPRTWRDYSSVVIDPADLVGNVRRARAFETDRNLAKIGRPVDRDEWFMTSQTVNAYYNPGMNEIVFPAAILQPPFFDVEADDAVNYGAIGAVIGHEIGHGFDDQGSRFDGGGTLRDWWTEEDRQRFEALAGRLVAQFGQLEPRQAPGQRVNGALTVGENIGDLCGLSIGHAAYRIGTEGGTGPVAEGLTGDQRFFMGWARIWRGVARPEEARRLLAVDPHAPMEHRANACRNLDQFQVAFGVRPGDGMWLAPEDRVRIF